MFVDGEFSHLEDQLDGFKAEAFSANKHIRDIKQLIQKVKERMHAI